MDAADQRRLLEFQRQADDLPSFDPETAAEVIVRGLSTLVPGDCVLYTATDTTLERCIATTSTDPGVLATQDGAYHRWLQLVREGGHPVIAHWIRSGDHGAIRLSDVIGGAAFHRLAIYDEFFRAHAIERVVGTRVVLSSRRFVDLVSYRSGSDFSERDRAMVDHARITVLQIARRVQMTSVVDVATRVLGLTRREAEVAAWFALGYTNSEIGGILFIAPGTVKKHIDRVFRKLGVGTRAAAAALVYAAARPRGSREGDDMGLVAGPLGLTRREADVLRLAAQGRSNAAIAGRLGIAEGTVHSHLRHVYDKLGVSNRTAALATAVAGSQPVRARRRGDRPEPRDAH